MTVVSLSRRAAHTIVTTVAILVPVTSCSVEDPTPDASTSHMDVADDSENAGGDGDSTSDADVDPCTGVTYESHLDSCDTQSQVCVVSHPSCSAVCSCRILTDALQWFCENHCEPEEDFFVPDDASN